MARFRLALLFLLATSSVATAQAPRNRDDSLELTHLNESTQLGTRFRNAEARAAQGQWAEAIEEYQRILVEAGDELAPVDKRHVVQARWLAQARLSALPPEALTLYRSRIDPPAKKLLDQGRASRDPALLQRIVDESFCSSYTEQALEILGDLSFERGDFEEADQLWRMIVRPVSMPATAPDAGLVVADPKLDVAGIRAKLILAKLFRGEIDNLTGDLEAFAKAHPGAKGKLAGLQGPYVDTLKSLATRVNDLGTRAGSSAWPQFAGNGQRNRALPKAEGRLAGLPCPDGPAWQVNLDTGLKTVRPVVQHGGDKIISWTEAGRLLGYYPAISGDRVVVANDLEITAYQLATGLPVFQYKLELNRDMPAKLATEPDVTFPVTVVGDLIYARLGTRAAGPPRQPRGFGGRRGGFRDFSTPPVPPQTSLVCLTMQPNLGQERWSKAPPPAPEQGAVVAFEGAPLVHQGRVYIAVTKFLTGQTESLVACYDADSGELRWQRQVCQTPELKDGELRTRHHLLTLAGPNIVYCSHSGAIVALDAASGHPRWGMRYASRGSKTADGLASPRSLAPCCYADGRIYAAPLDLDRILCLDSRTGQTLWESDPMEIVHILGVSRGKFFCSTLTPRRGIRALGAATGSPNKGWMQPGDGSDLSTYGRGLLAGDWIFWPTSKGLYVLDQADGEPVAFDADIRGNLIAADGCLVAADVKSLSAYIPDKWTLRRRTQEAARDGVDSSTLYRLALAEMDAGLFDRASSTLERALAMAEGTQQRDRARKKIHELLLQTAQTEARGQHWKKVQSLLHQAASDRFTVAERARAAALEGALAEAAGRAEEALAAWQTILETSELHDVPLFSREKVQERASAVAIEHINRLLRQRGRAIYGAVEARAEKLAGAGDCGPATCDRLERQFPQALATMRALEERARQAEKLDKPWEAASAYRALLDLPDAPLSRTILLAGLVRALERESCWDAVRSVLDQIENDGADHVEAAVHPSLTIREWVRERRRGLPSAPSIQAGDSPYFRRHWQAAGETNGIGVLSESGDCLFRVAGSKLDCLSTGAGKSVWSRELPWPARWLGVSTDLLVAACEREVLCIRQGDGAIMWRQLFDLPGATPLHGFQIVGGRLFFFEGASRFGEWEITSGRCLWCDWAPGSRLGLESPAGSFDPRALVSAKSTVLSTGLERPLLFDSRNGARLHCDWGVQVSARPHATANDGRLGLLSGRKAVQAVDLADGRPSWQFCFEAPQALAGEMPQVLQRDDHVFVQIAYNYGYLLEHLDAKTGKRHWPVPLFVGPRPLDLELGDVDELALYCSGPRGIEARDLVDGRLLWKQKSGTELGRRKMQRSGSILLNQPVSGDRIGWEFAWQGMAIRIPSLANRSSYAPFCTVEVLEPKMGQCLQSLNVAKPDQTTAKIAIGRTAFSLSPTVRVLGGATPVVLLTPERLLVMQGQALTAFDVTSGSSGLNGSASSTP